MTFDEESTERKYWYDERVAIGLDGGQQAPPVDLHNRSVADAADHIAALRALERSDKLARFRSIADNL